MKQVASALELGKERLARPERREERHHRRLEIRKEVGDIGQRFDAQQPLRFDEAKNEHERRCKQQADEHQHVASTACRQYVDEQQRCAGAERHRNGGKWHDRQHSRGVVGEGGASRGANSQQHRRQKHRDHPRGLPHRPGESREKQSPPRYRCGNEEAQVVGQEKRRERSDNAAEREEAEERQEQPRQSEAKQVVAELFECGELRREPVGANEEGTAHADPDRSKDARSQQIAALPSPRAIPHRPQLRREQKGKRRVRHTTSSISCSPAPPVSFKKTAVK